MATRTSEVVCRRGRAMLTAAIEATDHGRPDEQTLSTGEPLVRHLETCGVCKRANLNTKELRRRLRIVRMEMRRAAGLLLLALLLIGCATARPVPAAEARPVEPVIALHVQRFLAMLHLRLYDHRVLADEEHIVCLRGRARPDTLFVDDVSLTRIVHADDSTVVYLACRADDGFVGTAHNHVPGGRYGDACWQSAPDTVAQRQIGALIALVTCGTVGHVRIHGRIHPDYQQLLARRR